MGFTIYQDSDNPTIFRSVKRETATVNYMLSMDFDNPLGETIFKCNLIDEFDQEGERFRPLSGQRVRWQADDGTGTILFDGFIIDPDNEQEGFNEFGAEVLDYDLYAKDPTWLWEHKITMEGTFKNFRPGELIFLLANACDSRFVQAPDNDLGDVVPDQELGVKNYKDAIEELARSACLFVWVDANWCVHVKKWSTIIALSQEEKFNITDQNYIYQGLKLKTDTSKLANRVYCIGSKMDAGDINPTNRKAGVQKSEELIAIVTADLDSINFMRKRIGYEDLVPGTNPDELPTTTEGLFEKALNLKDIYDYVTLETIGNAYLDMYKLPLIRGSVSFKESGLMPGRSIYLNSETRGITTLLPVIELEVTARGGGFDANNNAVYNYTAYFNGPSAITEMARDIDRPIEKKTKAEIIMKPNPPELIGHTSKEETRTLNVSGVVIRSNENY
jgi:hypothetical protein